MKKRIKLKTFELVATTENDKNILLRKCRKNLIRLPRIKIAENHLNKITNHTCSRFWER